MGAELLKHNRTAYEAAVSMLEETGKAAVIHPTGTGKSFIAFKLCEDHPGDTVCWLAPSEYIFKTQSENWLAAGGEALQNIRFLTYAKLMLMEETELAAIRPDYIILDEFHRCGAEMWGYGVQRLLEQYPKAALLGLTATHIRYLDDQRDMAAELFDGNIASEMTLGDAIVRGMLNPPKYVLSVFACQKELEKLQMRVRKAHNPRVRDTAEAYLEALRRALEKADGLDVIFDKHMSDRKGKYIVFCANAEHMRQMIELSGAWFGKVDPSPHIYSVYSSDPSASRSFADFKADNSAHLRLLYCIDALNEGIHVEDVSGVILLRPTVSPIVFKQQIGRALSASRKKDAVIFDVVLNINNLYSIGSVEEEMQIAASYYRSLGESEEIVHEHFRIIDEVQDCITLFEKLGETLSASWSVMYECAEDYYRAHGDLLVPAAYVTEEGMKLGAWIQRQRLTYKRKTIAPEQIKSLEAIGMEWDNQSWMLRYNMAKRYYRQNKTLDIPQTTVIEGCWLGKWIAVQKKQYENGRLDGRQRMLLSELPLEQVGRKDKNWQCIYEDARTYYQTQGDLKVPQDYIGKSGFLLADWLVRQRRERNLGRLSEAKILKLDAIGFVWQLESAWEEGFRHAKAFYEENGHLNMPGSYTCQDGYALGKWVCNYRRSHNGQTSSVSISDEQAALLESVGMDWNPDSRWDVNYEMARRYYSEHGSLPVSRAKVTEDTKVLMFWLNNQRKSYRLGYLTAKKIKQLAAIGITEEWLAPQPTPFEKGFSAAKAFYEENGHLQVPTGYRSANGFWLGSWVVKIRRKKEKLAPEQIRRLDAIGFVWERLRTEKVPAPKEMDAVGAG